MSIINRGWVYDSITRNRDSGSVSYRWTHGATDYHMGDGLLIYSIIQYMRAKVFVCLGSGGGFIPRIMSQARKDLHDQKIFEGNNEWSWGDIGVTFIGEVKLNVPAVPTAVSYTHLTLPTKA